MSETVLLILVAVLALTSITMTVMYFRKPQNNITSRGAMERIKDVGELTALTMVYKDASYISEEAFLKLFGGKKLLVISEHEIEYRFNLRRCKVSKSNSRIVIEMPPCHIKVSSKPPITYHEEKGKLVGIPFFDIKVEDRNKLITNSYKIAGEKAAKKTEELKSSIEHSAESTLKNIFLSAGVEDITISFSNESNLIDMVKRNIESSTTQAA